MLVENFKMAVAAILANKMRAFLTMLGIIIGIGSVIITTALGDSVRKMFSDIYAGIGVTQGMLHISGEDFRESDLFTIDDIEKYKSVFGKDLVYIDAMDSANIELKTNLKKESISLSGVLDNFLSLQPQMEMVEGRFISTSDVEKKRTACVIAEKDALELYGTNNVVGRTFRVNFNQTMTEFHIVGVYRLNMSPIQKLLMGNTLSGTMYVPWSLFDEENNAGMSVLRFFANPKMTSEQLGEFNRSFKSYVSKTKKRSEGEIQLESAQESMTQADGVLSGLSIVLGSIAAISLLVGGIGIMNIMLVSVTERTREIGTRKALGATTKDILTQFLIESAVLSMVGGMLGVLFAVSVVSAAGAILKMSVVISIPSIVIAVGFSALVGVFFGIFPARKAAKKDPIEALRYE